MYTRLKSLFAIKGYTLFVFCMMFLGIALSITTPYLPLYSTEKLGMTAATFGIFMAISSLSGVFVNRFIAKRSDNGLNRKNVIIMAMITSAIGYAAYLLFHNYFVLLIIVTIFSGLGATAMPQIFASAQESANESRSDDKTFAMSTLRSLFSLGFLIGPLGGTIILARSGYKGLFLGTTIIFIFIAVLVMVFLKKKVIEKKTVVKKANDDAEILNSNKIRLPYLAFIFLAVINSINFINTPLLMVNELHGTHKEVGIVVSLCAGLEIPIMLFLGSIAKKISNHTLIIYSCFVGVAYYIVLAVATDPWMVIVAQILQATVVSITMGNGLSYFNDLLPKSPGMSATLYSNSSTIGRLIGNLGGGIAASLIGFRYVNWICMVIVILTLIILQKSKPNR